MQTTPETWNQGRPSWRLDHKSRARFSIASLAALVLLVPMLVTITTSPSPSRAADVTVLGNIKPTTVADPDRISVELGAKFVSSREGTVTAIRFYKSAVNTGPHVANLWSPTGKLLATATLPKTASKSSGWQTVQLPKAVKIAKNQKYVASYIAPNGRYSADEHGLDRAKSKGPLTILAGGGVYAYGKGGTYPSNNYKNSNYYVDVVFSPSGVTLPTASPTSKPPATTKPPTPVAPKPSATAPPTKPPRGNLPAGVTIRGVDGGNSYYGKFSNPLPDSASYFPIAVWYESLIEPADAMADKSVGLNTYIELTSNSNLKIATGAGMHAITSWKVPGQSGSLMPDEVDMWAGPGTAKWTGNWPGEGEICEPANARCGYTILADQKAAAAKGSMIFANYGKGVTFWHSDSEAAKFVNDYPDVISDDNYWFTDPNICGISEGGTKVSPQRQLGQDECRLAANYGWTIDRIRSLVSPKASKPVWAFVEVGHPFSENWAPTITAPQIKAAVWSSLIHGARGVIYFNHNFGGDCQSQHVLRDGCGAQIRPAVTSLNAQITALAPVLNSPFLDGAAISNGSVDTSVRVNNSHLYLFAGATKNVRQQVSIAVKCSNATSATVLGENRQVPVTNGVLSDTFADGNAVHLYQFNGTNSCGI